MSLALEDYRPLASGLKVSKLWLGTMMFGDRCDEAEAAHRGCVARRRAECHRHRGRLRRRRIGTHHRPG